MTSYLDKRFYSDVIFDDDKGAVISSFDASGELQARFMVKPGFRLFNWIGTVYETKNGHKSIERGTSRTLKDADSKKTKRCLLFCPRRCGRKCPSFLLHKRTNGIKCFKKTLDFFVFF